jgi:hypothetical protein
LGLWLARHAPKQVVIAERELHHLISLGFDIRFDADDGWRRAFNDICVRCSDSVRRDRKRRRRGLLSNRRCIASAKEIGAASGNGADRNKYKDQSKIS